MIRRGIYDYLMKTEYGRVFFVLTVCGLTAIIDIFTITVLSINLPLSQYSYLVFVLCMTQVLARNYSNKYEMLAIENTVLHDNSLTNAGLTPDEIKVAVLHIEGETKRDIQRKLHLTSAEIDRYENEIRNKLILLAGQDPGISLIISKYKLTRREADMLRCLRLGQSNEEIAAELFISVETVRTHVRHLLRKLSLENKNEISAFVSRVSGEPSP